MNYNAYQAAEDQATEFVGYAEKTDELHKKLLNKTFPSMKIPNILPLDPSVRVIDRYEDLIEEAQFYVICNYCKQSSNKRRSPEQCFKWLRKHRWLWHYGHPLCHQCAVFCGIVQEEVSAGGSRD